MRVRAQKPAQVLLRLRKREKPSAAAGVFTRTGASGDPRINLVSHVGAGSAPELVAHFLEHYYRLGVDRFLIILHGSRADSRAVAIVREIERYGVGPVLWVDSFSCALKRGRYQRVVKGGIL